MPEIVLAPALDLPAAAPLLATLIAMRGQNVGLDASGVQRIGGQCLQVLLAGQAAWSSDGKSFQVTQASDAFRDALDVMGAGLAFGSAEVGGSQS